MATKAPVIFLTADRIGENPPQKRVSDLKTLGAHLYSVLANEEGRLLSNCNPERSGEELWPNWSLVPTPQTYCDNGMKRLQLAVPEAHG